MSELLNDYFASVFTKENTIDLPAVKSVFTGENEKLCNFLISPQMVLDKLKKLKMNKASGVDLIGTRMLIELSEVVCDIVAKIYNKSLRTGDIPKNGDWLMSQLCLKREKVFSIKLQTY